MRHSKALMLRDARQSCLRGGIAVNENRLLSAQFRFHHETHHQIQAAIPAEAGQLFRLQPLFTVAFKVPVGDGHRVDARNGLHRLTVAEGYRRRALQPATDQICDFPHQLLIVKANAVPLQHGEFRIVTFAALTVTKHSGNLEY